MQTKTFLFLARRSPGQGSNAAELLEAAMMAGAFDQEVHLAFLDDGVFQLLGGQQAGSKTAKAVAPLLELLGETEIEAIWVERQSLEERGVADLPLAVEATIVERDELARLIARMDVVIGG